MRTSLCLLIYIPSNVQESREKDNVGTVAYLKGYRSSKFRSINQGEKRRHRGTSDTSGFCRKILIAVLPQNQVKINVET